MKIGIDARSILNPEKTPEIGVGHYTYQLIRHLLEIDQENQYTLFFDYRVREKDVKKFSKENVKIQYFPWSDYKKYLPGAYSEILGLATLRKENFDVLHITSPDARVPVGYGGKVICTFQDLSVYKQPELFSKAKKIKSRYNRQAMAKRADQIIAVSDSTKRDLKEYFSLDAKKIKVIKNGVDKRFFNIPEERKKLGKMLKRKFGINREYILFVGTIEPSKNITRLMQAFRIFKDLLESKGEFSDYQLIIGGKEGWLSGKYLQIAKDLGINEDIKFLGYVEGDDLKSLFSQAKLFVMPSLYEGFGMTVLEAMASKTPCLVSDIDPLKETADGGAEFVDPYDVEKMADKMRQLVNDKEKNKNRAKKGYEIAKRFSWKDCAEKTLETYKLFENKS
ncbi:MAG: glycosyltransferase family 4 protein [Patescibacteria group bacterium]